MMRSVLLAIDSIPSSYLGQPIVHLHFVTKFKSWTLGFSLRVPNRLWRRNAWAQKRSEGGRDTPEGPGLESMGAEYRAPNPQPPPPTPQPAVA